MLAYAEQLTRDPASIGDAETDTLRTHGFNEASLWEIAFTTAIFNLFPRMAEAFGIEPAPARVSALDLDE
jgi:alkylhydroperoxidase family enzyme